MTPSPVPISSAVKDRQRFVFQVLQAGMTPAEALRRFGPLLAVTIGVSPRTEECLVRQGLPVPVPQGGLAFIDPGSDYTYVSPDALAHLGARRTARGVMLETINHKSNTPDWFYEPVGLTFLGASFGVLETPEVVGKDSTATAPSRVVAMIGRDFLSGFRFEYDGATGELTLGRHEPS